MKTRDIVILCAALSCGVSATTVAVMQRLPFPWRANFIQADTMAIGGGAGQGSIILSATRELDGSAMLIMRGAAGGETLRLSVAPKGFPVAEFTSANEKVLFKIGLWKGQPQMQMFNAGSGQPVWSVTIDEKGQPVVHP